MDLIKITPDSEKARNMLKMSSLLKERIKTQDKEKMAALIIVDYYEMAKELITSILLLDGYKTLSHKDLIIYLKERYSDFSSHEISLLDDLRILRNRVSYDGFSINPSFLYRNENFFKQITQKLEILVEKKLNNKKTERGE